MIHNEFTSPFSKAMRELTAAVNMQRTMADVVTDAPDKNLNHDEMLEYLGAIRMEKAAEKKIYELLPE